MEFLNSNAYVLLALLAAVLVPLALSLLSTGSKKRPTALDPSKKVELVLESKTTVSHDTFRFRFALQSKDHILGLPVGQHIELSYTDSRGEEVSRKYTPISSDKDVGFVEFIIKVYFKTERFPAGGQMTQYMHSLAVGDKLAFQGPNGTKTYKGNGTFAVKQTKSQGGGFAIRKAKRVGMIAGGSGITPMLQVLTAIVEDPTDKTEVFLLFANQTEEDILCRDMLEGLAKRHPQFKALPPLVSTAPGEAGATLAVLQVWYTLDRPPPSWAYSSGFINEDMIKEHLPSASADTQILMCGPMPMITHACKPNLLKLGFVEKDHFLIW